MSGKLLITGKRLILRCGNVANGNDKVVVSCDAIERYRLEVVEIVVTLWRAEVTPFPLRRESLPSHFRLR